MEQIVEVIAPLSSLCLDGAYSFKKCSKVLNEKPQLISWQSSAFKEVNWLGPIRRYSKYTYQLPDEFPSKIKVLL